MATVKSPLEVSYDKCNADKDDDVFPAGLSKPHNIRLRAGVPHSPCFNLEVSAEYAHQLVRRWYHWSSWLDHCTG